MKSWLFKLSGLFCVALCFASTANAGISNMPPAKQKQISAKKELKKAKSSTATQTSSRNANKKSVKLSSRKSAKNAQINKKSSKSKSTRITVAHGRVAPTPVRGALHNKKAKSESIKQNSIKHTKTHTSSSTNTLKSSSPSVTTTQAPTAPMPVRTSLLIKKMHPTKKSKAKGKLQRGKRGRAGKDGKRGKKGKKGSKGSKGDKGEKGDGGITAPQSFVSAVSVGINANAASLVAVGDTVKSFHVVNINNISYNPATGLFTSLSGPGYYEIHYGASWNGQCAVVLRVDGNEVNPFIDLNAPATWARESIIIRTNEAIPTFALANAKASAAPMILTGNGSYSSAFITIKKLS